MRRAALALVLSCAGPVLAQDIQLVTPIDCDLENTCYIQQHMDRGSAPGMQDYQCQAMGNEDHSGTDFALPSLKMMHDGVAVVAAAPGIVQSVRDGAPDTGFTAKAAETVKGRECGNGVLIEHKGGWSTTYCHLRQGSILIRSGQQVAAGDIIGKVGKSGAATFPHLHFTLRKDGDRIDPFDPTSDQICATAPKATLWQDPPPYRAGGLIAVGLFERLPEYAEVKAGTPHLKTLSRDIPVLALWSYSFATRKDDVLRMAISGPNGTIIAKDITLPKPQVLAMRAIGKKRGAKRWASGIYLGTVTLLRDGKALETRKIALDMP